jgi:sulfofructose kinase
MCLDISEIEDANKIVGRCMPKLLVVGAAVMDCVYTLDELPVAAEKFRAKSLALRGGGTAATAAVTARRLGIDVALAARVGDDFFGDAIVDELENESVDCKLVRKCPGCRSSVSAVMIDSRGERMLVNFKDSNIDSGTDWLPQKLPSEIHGVLGDHHWEAGTEHLFRLAREAGKPAILDADRQTSIGILASGTHIGFSARGLREQSGIESLPEALAWCQTQVPGWLAVTDGENGALFTEEGGIAHEPALKVLAVDTNGAGDVWHGALAVALLEGQEPRKAVCFANAAASIKCSRGGGRSAIPARREVEAFL